MRTWLLLAGAIVCEVAGTMSLRAAVDHPAWVAAVAVGYAGAFALLAAVLRRGMPIGVAYGVWGAVGVALTAVLGAVLFAETLSAAAIAGIVAIMIGVALIEAGSHPPARPGSAVRRGAPAEEAA
jgi:small multidrug resistance pump